MVEVNAALIAACLPTIHFLFKRSSFNGIYQSVHRKISQYSLRRLRSSNDGGSGVSKPSMEQSHELGKEERYHFYRLQGLPSVESRVEKPQSAEATGEGIKVTQALQQEEMYIQASA